MLTLIEIATMRARKNAAKGALRFFKHIVPVKSPNKLSCYIGRLSARMSIFLCGAEEQQNIIEGYREEGYISIMDSFNDAVRTGLGNCMEMAAICYAGLAGNPAIIHNSVVTFCKVVDHDHSVVIVSDAGLGSQSNVRIRDLGKTAMVVDGWSHDWYFPNLDTRSAYLNHLYNFPNLRQFSIRHMLVQNILGIDICNNFRTYPRL